jgi:hypothetical protein
MFKYRSKSAPFGNKALGAQGPPKRSSYQPVRARGEADQGDLAGRGMGGALSEVRQVASRLGACSLSVTRGPSQLDASGFEASLNFPGCPAGWSSVPLHCGTD